MTDLAPGDTAYWFNTMSCTNREVTIVAVRKTRYVVETSDGHRYTPPKSMVSREPVQL